ncbi:MAG: hypothetical protein EB084_06445 [Proteobacteria bacterium]|nr:hypothetical protein [Pseudomonadota bacterium]
MTEVKTILESFCKLDGVRGALVVEAGGQVQESACGPDVDVEGIARLVDASSTLGRQTASTLGLEGVTQSYVEYEAFTVTAESFGDRALVVVASAGANLGRLRLEIRKNKKMLESLGG